MLKIHSLISFSVLLVLSACNSTPENSSAATEALKMNIKEETVTYSAETLTMNGFVAYNDASTDKRPVVLIVHEWWGLNDYTKNRARQLAKLGYLAIAVDLYGNGETADNPEKAQKLAMPFYKDPHMAQLRFDAALAKIKSYAVADPTKIAAIGYCFGGGVVLNVARMGEDLKGVVCFHGSLLDVAPDKNLLKAEVLVCQGDSDKFVTAEEVATFQTQMDSIGAHYAIKHYANATHAFTNPAATETGKKFSLPIRYNAEADSASFNDMLSFFDKIFK
ncbi:MAG: dienelactone hydrolase family protein [Bacteroidota bacterium]